MSRGQWRPSPDPGPGPAWAPGHEDDEHHSCLSETFHDRHPFGSKQCKHNIEQFFMESVNKQE